MPDDRVVLLHGFLGNAASFDEVLSLLQPECESLRPALYGHRGYPELEPAHDFESEVNRLAALIEPYAGTTRVHLAGYSLGARLALALLVRSPQLFHSATLVSGRRGLDSPVEREQRLAADQLWAAQLRSQPLEQFLRNWEKQPLFAPMQRVAPETLARLRIGRLRHISEALARAIDALSLARMPNLLCDVGAIEVPVTLLAGGLDSKFVELGKELASRLPKSNFIVVDGAGHSLLVERPDAVAAAIREGWIHAHCYLENSPNL